MTPLTAVSMGFTEDIEGLLRSVRVVRELEGLMEPLESSDGGPEGDPSNRVESPDAMSPPVLSWRRRFRLNLARAFWNQTCRG